jgi:pentatricopeptide repeat protein
MASAYSSSKEYNKALQFYNKMLEKDTGDIYIYYQIADLYEQMGKTKKAIKGYKSVIMKDPGYTQAYVQLGKLYYEKVKDYKKAKQYLETANEKEIMNYGYSYYGIEVHYYLGMIAVREGKKMDAILSYLELKNIYTYTPEDNEKKLKLYKAIKNLE